MTVRQAAERLKQAALVLAGYRPAEVRFDRRDRWIASTVAVVCSDDFFWHHPDNPALVDEVKQLIAIAIESYATFEKV